MVQDRHPRSRECEERKSTFGPSGRIRAKYDDVSSYEIAGSRRIACGRQVLSAKLGVLHEHLERQHLCRSTQEYEARDAINGLLRSTLRLKGRLDDWPQAATSLNHDRDWKVAFLAGLENTTVFSELICSVRMADACKLLEYVHQQFEEKSRRPADNAKLRRSSRGYGKDWLGYEKQRDRLVPGCKSRES